MSILNNEDIVSLLSSFGTSEDTGHLQVFLLVHLPRVNDQHDVHLLLRRDGPQSPYHLVLQIEFVETLCLSADEELQIVKND